MAKKLFILGLPGSGKSKVARHIAEILEKARLVVIYENDFEILKSMFESDRDGLFKPANKDGVFDVINPVAFDIASSRLGEVVSGNLPPGNDTCMIIEFSRNNYKLAFSLFPSDFLRDAYYLHLGTSVPTCKNRVTQRAAKPVYKDDYPVSNFIFEKYYHSDDGKYLPTILKKYGVVEQHVLTLHNDGSFEAIVPAIEKFAASALLEESKKPEPQPVS